MDTKPHRGIDCIIPARGGSKRFPGKNLALLDGKPLIAYVIEAALKSGIFEVVMVSTDDAAIGEMARDCGAQVAVRTADLATDTARVKDVVMHELDILAYTRGKFMGRAQNDYLAVIYPTAALIPPDVIIAMWNMLQLPYPLSEADDGILTIVRPMEHPLGALRQSTFGLISPHFYGGGDIPQSQVLPELWMDAGAVYMYRVGAFRQWGFFPPRLRGYMLPRLMAVDVDYPEDMEVLRAFKHQASTKTVEGIGRFTI